MNRRRFALAMLFVLGALSGCQGATSPEKSSPAPSRSATAAGDTPSPPAGSPSVTPDATAVIDPAWVTRPALTCGDNKRLFPPETLEGPGIAEFGLDPASAVLRTTIADTPDYYPDSGWHRVLESPDGVTFVARGNPETPWFGVTIG